MSRLLHFRRTALVLAIALTLPLLLNAQKYTRTDLTQDMSGVSATAPNTDPNLVNPWGLARGQGSPWWISDNGTGLTTLYDASGVPQSTVITVAAPAGASGPAAPTGALFNDTNAFELAPGMKSIFLFVTEDGTISGWNPGVNATSTVIKVDRSGKAIYKGAAIAITSSGPRLYATNFQTGHIEVYDGSFNRVRMHDDAFSGSDDDHGDRGGFVPFNIQNVGGNLVVTFAKKQPGSRDESHGAGLGRVVIFDTDGRKLVKLENGQWFNAPWGVALAPADFGAFSHRLLIGNFGDGSINAFDFASGKHVGAMLDTDGNPLSIDGLWAISFAGNSKRNGLSTELYFTSGPSDESHGIFGKLAAASDQRGNTE